MNFFSFEFIVFFTIVVTCFYLFPRRQFSILSLASLFFIISWHWLFLIIHLFHSSVGYAIGQKIHRSDSKLIAQRWLIAGVCLQFCSLFFFKYFGGLNWSVGLFSNSEVFSSYSFSLLIPIGISYYTFQITSYLVDIYRKEATPADNFGRFLLFSLFFPQLIMGPIERFNGLYPQFRNMTKINISKFLEGAYLISLGVLKRLIVVNTLSPIYIKSIAEGYSGESYGYWFILEVIYGYIYFYCDFSSYMNIVRGLARFFSINMAVNFNQPYFSTNPVVSWQRWHMTLTFWIRDYIYLPLMLKTKRPLICIFALYLGLGFFHEISLRFFLWAMYWSALTVIYMFYVRHIKRRYPILQGNHLVITPLKILTTFLLICYISLFSWVQSFEHLILATKNLFILNAGFSDLSLLNIQTQIVILLCLVFIVLQETRYKDQSFSERKWELVFCFYLNIILAVGFGAFRDYSFQYLNF